MLLYRCDSCGKEITEFGRYPIKYEKPGGYIYELDLCRDCVNFIHRQIKDGINMAPCDAVNSNE